MQIFSEESEEITMNLIEKNKEIPLIFEFEVRTVSYGPIRRVSKIFFIILLSSDGFYIDPLD